MNELTHLTEVYRREREAHAANLKEWQKCEAKIARLKEAVDFYDKALSDPNGHDVGAVRDGWEWIIEVAREITR